MRLFAAKSPIFSLRSSYHRRCEPPQRIILSKTLIHSVLTVCCIAASLFDAFLFYWLALFTALFIQQLHYSREIQKKTNPFCQCLSNNLIAMCFCPVSQQPAILPTLAISLKCSYFSLYTAALRVQYFLKQNGSISSCREKFVNKISKKEKKSIGK